MPVTKITLRGSTRIKEFDKRRIIDETARKRRHRKLMEIFEADNYHDDPHADLVMSKKIPKFEENLESRTRSKKKERTPEYYQMKYRKNFQQLVEEDRIDAELNKRMSYLDAAAEDSKFPQRHFCAVCGYISTYVCITCGTRFCCIKCMHVHLDTRCLKWSA